MVLDYIVVNNCIPGCDNVGYPEIRNISAEGRYLFLLCDGIGDAQGSEMASRFVSDEICRHWSKQSHSADSVTKIWAYCRKIKYLLKQYDKQLYPQKGLHYHSFSHMWTSVAMVSVKAHKAFFMYSGNCQIYLVRNNVVLYQSADKRHKNRYERRRTDTYFGKSHYMPKVDDFMLQNGDLILICSHPVCRGKHDRGFRKLLEADGKSFNNELINHIDEHPKGENYSVIAIRVVCTE